MEEDMDALTVMTGVGVAGYAALMLAYVAHVDLGLSGGEIRGLAIVAAVLIALAIAIDFLGKRLSNVE
jgi:hypothetical protein